MNGSQMLQFSMFAMVVFGGAEAAYANTISVFNDFDSFAKSISTVNTTVSMETFDEFPTVGNQPLIIGTGSFTLDGIVYTAAVPDARWLATQSFVPVSPPNSLDCCLAATVGVPFTLTPQQQQFSPGGIGFYMRGNASFPPLSYQIEAKDNAGDDYLATFVFSGSNWVFFGFSSDQGISSVTITPVLFAGAIGGLHLDNVSIAAAAPVPEPSSLSLVVVAGFITVLCLSQRRRKTACDRAFHLN